ncbi:hypothetical protein LAT59_00725 [Candidatus Gracilibacteria bacterium]|nr:hypothetical protein [Candidatus Gracilibacteria bacterium]
MKRDSLPFTLLRILLLTIIFVGIFQIGNFTISKINENKKSEEQVQGERSNATLFQSAYSSQFGVIGVALSTRVGMMYEDGMQSTDARHYTGLRTLPTSGQERREARERLLRENTLMVREYYNISRTDIIDTLKTSSDRRRTLDNFVNQIELRGSNALRSIESLENQKRLYLNEINRISQAIEIEKNILESEFTSGDTQAVVRSSERYFLLRNEYTELFTDIVFINQYLRQYDFLNEYNAGIVNVLKVNRQAIIDQSYIVIPNRGDEFLRPLELIFDETNMPR